MSFGFAVIKKPAVKKFFRIPIVPVAPPSTNSAQPPSFSSLFAALKQSVTEKQEQISPPAASSKLTDHRISSSSVISQRLKSLEKQVKGRKKNKKR